MLIIRSNLPSTPSAHELTTKSLRLASFNFSEARSQTQAGNTANYWRITIPDGFTNYTLSFLAAGSYGIGIVTHHTDYTGSYFSEYNENILTCVVNPAQLDGSTTIGNCTL